MPHLLQASLLVRSIAGQQQQQQSEPGTAFCYRVSPGLLPRLHAADGCYSMDEIARCDELLRCLGTVCDGQATDLLVL